MLISRAKCRSRNRKSTEPRWPELDSEGDNYRSSVPKLKMRSSVTLFLFALLSFSGVEGQQQSFRSRPVDADVKLGDTAILRCEVENQAGAAQWTKDGFALGYDRAILGFSRYSMVGDSDKGVHNLRIVNVTLKDIAEFQCQVGPSKSNRAIRAEAKLNVLIPPNGIEISNHAPEETITLKERDQTELECVVKEARPAASIIWYKNDLVIRTESREDSTEEVEVLEDGVHIKKNTTKSRIRFMPTSEDDKAKYTCEARHPALVRPQRVSVHLSVQYSPGAPRIDGYLEGESVRENQQVKLTCISRGGNPLAELIWYKNDVRVDSSYMSLGKKESRNELLFVATTRDNLARYRCEASNIMITTPKIADIVLTVMFPPKEVKTTGPREAKIGDNVTLTCATSNSNPKVDMAWYKGGVSLESAQTTNSVSPDGGWISSSKVTVKIEPTDRTVTIACQAMNRGLGESKGASHIINVIQPPGPPKIYMAVKNITVGQMQRLSCTSTGGHPPANLTWYRGKNKVDSAYSSDGNMATAELSLETNMTDNGISYRCEAKNKAISQPLSETVTFHVFFPPSSVVISTKPKKLREGEKAYLTCESASSNPPAVVTWWRNGNPVPAQTNQTKDGKHGGKKTVTMLELDLTSDYDGAVYTCQAINSAVRRSVHDAITLQVSYKPKFVESVGERVSVVEGEPKAIFAKANGNPDTISYTWKKNGSSVRESSRVSVNASLLNFTEANRKDKGVYECEAKNSEGSASLSIELDVQYPANIVTAVEWLMVGEGEDAHLECAIDANPLEESMVTWTKEEEGGEDGKRTQTFQDNKSYLTISNVSIKEAGAYVCSVDNGIGAPANKSIFLVVKHKPDIDMSPGIGKAASNKGETGKLICRAKGAPNVTFSWAKEGRPLNSETAMDKYSIKYERLDLITWQSVLEIRRVDIEDYGSYECIARNELDSATHYVKLNVTSSPDPPIGLRVLNFTHDTVTLAWVPGFDGGFPQSYKMRFCKAGNVCRYDDVPENLTTYAVTQLSVGMEYAFAIQAINKMGESNFTTENVRQETSNVGPNSLSTSPDAEFPPNLFSKLVISVFIVVGAMMLLINVLLIACFLKRRSKKRLTSASEQGSSKSATIEMYAPSSYNETVNGETLSSISEKSATFSHGEHHDEYIDESGKAAVSTYLVDQMNHHHSVGGYPFRDVAYRASTLPRQPKHPLDITLPPHHEDDGYVDALRRNAYNQGDKMMIYGRTTPRPSSRPPQVPPIPELYNIPPEARYVPCPPPGFGSPPMGNGSIRAMSHSSSHGMLNGPSSFGQSNGRVMMTNGLLSPVRGSILTTFAPNPSPNSIEHEGHLV